MNDIPYELVLDILGSAQGRDLNPGLREALQRAADLVASAGGRLRSRQAIAAIIVAWELANPNERALT